jgi:exodeoxyribonuclease III
MKLISWNVNGGRAGRIQAEALLAESPHVIALQEVREGCVERWLADLQADGFDPTCVFTTRALCEGRRNFLLTASRYPMTEVPLVNQVPYPERLLMTTISANGRDLTLINTHVPDGSGHGWRKVEHFEGLYSLVGRMDETADRILCGDFNSPRRELADGRVITWAQREDGAMRRARGPRWDAAERSVIAGLRAFAMVDAYRHEHPYGSGDEDASWVGLRNGKYFRRRFDHVFASSRLAIHGCKYIHAWREGPRGLSDHSAISVELEWP